MIKIEGFRCTCEGDPTKLYPVDHYTSRSCRKPPIPLAQIRSILRREQGDHFHAENRVTITRCLSCPRSVVLTDNVPLKIKIKEFDSRHKGNIIHDDLAKYAEDDEFAEFVVPPAPLLGYPVTGRLDLVKRDFSEISDYKLHSEFAQKNKMKPRPQFQDVDAQLNIGRILIARGVLGVEPESYRPTMWAVHGAQVSKTVGAEPWASIEGKYMSEAELGEFHPLGGKMTVKEILYELFRFQARLAAGAELREAIKETSLAGRSMIGGTMCSLYCDAKETCDEFEGICTRVI